MQIRGVHEGAVLIGVLSYVCFFFFSSRRRHTRSKRDWSSDVCSSDLLRHEVRIFASAEGRNLPAGLPVVCLDLRHALDDELFSHLARALVFLPKLRAKRDRKSVV